MYVKGNSILEVIVSTVIILICFLLFSSLLGSLYGRYSVVPSIKILYTLNADVQSRNIIDTNRIKSTCNQCSFKLQSIITDSIGILDIGIIDKSTSHSIMLFHQMQDE